MNFSILRLLYVCIFPLTVTAQDFIPLEVSPPQDWVSDLIELENGNYLYIHTYYDDANAGDTFWEVDSVYTTIKLTDSEFNLIQSYSIISASQFEIIKGEKIFRMENGSIRIYGKALESNSSFVKNCFIELNADLNEVNRFIFGHADNMAWIGNSIINFDGNLVTIAGRTKSRFRYV